MVRMSEVDLVICRYLVLTCEIGFSYNYTIPNPRLHGNEMESGWKEIDEMGPSQMSARRVLRDGSFETNLTT